MYFWIIGTAVIGYLLENYTQSFQPYFDAFLATSVAFSAQWMLSKKYIGTWAFVVGLFPTRFHQPMGLTRVLGNRFSLSLHL